MTSNPLARPVPFGGLLKVSATIVFGGYFVTALVIPEGVGPCLGSGAGF